MSILFYLVKVFCNVLTVAILARAILSWFPLAPGNPIMTWLNQITEPLLNPLRRVIPRFGMLDITPMVAIVILQLIAGLIPSS